MKHTMRILTLLMLAIVVGTGQTWAGEPVVELGYIVCNEANITGGTLTFYKDASCEHAIDFSGGKSGNLSSEDLASVTGGYTVYIKAVPNSTHTLGAADNTTHAVTFIKAEKTTNVFQARRKGSAPDPTLNLGHDITVTATDKRFVYSFTMPANGANATIHANFPAREVQQVEYVDANGVLQTGDNRASAYVIDGNETELGVTGETTWYVVPAGTISYTSGLRCVGNVNLIIADGATMAIGTADSPVSGDGLFSVLDLNIFGQSAGTGVLHTNSSFNGIYVMNGTLTITNCTVDAVCSGNSSYGINGYKGITINGKSDGSNSVTIRSNKYGIYSPSGSVAITNCTVDVVCSGNDYNGISGSDGITITGKSDGTNSVTIRSNGYGLYTSNGPVAITNCNVTVTGATLTGNTYDPCSDNGINGTQGITIKGCAAGNTVTVRSNNSCLSSMGGSLAITNCTVDVVCSGNSSSGISGSYGITINGKSDGTNSVTIRSNKYGISTPSSVAITNCNVEVTGATLTDNGYNSCSQEGINGTQGITIEGCATGNTVMVRSANSCLYSNHALAITNCMVDVVSTGNHAIWGTSNVNFNGGQLTAMAPDNYNGVNTMGTITLGWANAETDFIKVSKYYGSTAVKIADGQHFRATKKENDTETTVAIISGTVNTDVIASLAGATLKPLEITGYVVTAVGTGLTAGTTIAYINGDTKFYVYGEGATVTVGNTGEGIVKVTGMDVSDSHTFTMPAEDVILTSDVLDNDLFTLANSSVDYNAGAQVPGIKYNNADFAEAYYTLTYMKDDQSTPTSEVQNSGNYAVTLTGKGAYIGEVNIAEKFVINPSLVGATTLYASGSTNQWMTWCGTEELVTPEAVTVYTVSSIDDSSVTLNEFTGTATFGTQTMKVIPAYTPVLIYRETVGNDALYGMFNAECEGTTGIQTAEGTNFAFFGTTTELTTIPDGNYTVGQSYVLHGDRFLLCKDNTGIGVNKCWLVLNSANGARQLSISIGSDEDTTSMEDVRWQTEEGSDDWYSLDGRKLDGQPTKKGVYIYKGKKVVIN